MRPPSSSSNFVIQGGGDTFASKQQQLSELLSQAAKDCNKNPIASSLSENEMEILRRGKRSDIRSARPTLKQNRSEMRQYRGKESLFKRPEAPAPFSARKSVADYHRNPHKWVKYSLDDVQTDQMSDRSNAQAAFSFLNELRARKRRDRCKSAADESMDTDEPESDGDATVDTSCKFTTRIPFRKIPMDREKEDDRVIVVDRDDKPVFRNSKIILPEYVVGAKKERKTRTARPVGKIDRSKQMKLAHLEEIDE